jgi:hypothetical protein
MRPLELQSDRYRTALEDLTLENIIIKVFSSPLFGARLLGIALDSARYYLVRDKEDVVLHHEVHFP